MISSSQSQCSLSLLLFLLVVFAILSTPSSASNRSAGGISYYHTTHEESALERPSSVFYVSNSISEQAETETSDWMMFSEVGSRERPFPSLPSLARALSDGVIQPGDSVLFRRGDKFAGDDI